MEELFAEVRKGYYESRCEAAARALEKRWFDARWFSTAEVAVEAILDLVPPGSTIGAGGSVTLMETGVLDLLAGRGDTVVRHERRMELEENLGARRRAIASPYYLCSSNAITMEGELVNTDGIGNRVAGMSFGPSTVIVLAGANKLVADRDAGFSRIREVAAPANARRLGLNLPCVEKGRCVDCREPGNICRVTTVISMRPIWTDFKVFLVAERLGL